MEEVSQCIREWKLKNLYLRTNKRYVDRNQEPTIIRQIQHVRFPNLVYIGLGGNGIQSIEALARIGLPAIKEIGISRRSIM